MPPSKKTRDLALSHALVEPRDLPPGARRVLERVFYAVGTRVEPLATVIPLRPRGPDRPPNDRD